MESHLQAMSNKWRDLYTPTRKENVGKGAPPFDNGARAVHPLTSSHVSRAPCQEAPRTRNVGSSSQLIDSPKSRPSEEFRKNNVASQGKVELRGTVEEMW